jgi:hypothetical protein
MQQRLWEHLDLTMRSAQHAEQVLRTTDINDEDAVEGMTALMDEVLRKHDGIRNEMASHGVTVPMAPTADLSQAMGPTGRRMAFERQIGDIKEACVQVLQLPVCVTQGCCSEMCVCIHKHTSRFSVMDSSSCQHVTPNDTVCQRVM